MAAGSAARRVCRTSKVTADDVVDALTVARDEAELALLALRGGLSLELTPGERAAIAEALFSLKAKADAVEVALEIA